MPIETGNPSRFPSQSAFDRRVNSWQAIAGLAVILVAIPIAFRMEPRNFLPFLDGNIWVNSIMLGIGITIAASSITIVASLPLAVGFALGRMSHRSWIRWPSVLYLEMFRALPLLVLMYFAFYTIPRDLPGSIERGFMAVVIALILYTAALNGETIRAGILAIDRGQTEAARSLGLSYWQSMRFVLLPQAFRNVLPPLIAQFATLVKDTSLGVTVGMVELLSRGRFIFQTYRNPVETLYVIGILYFVLIFVLELASVGIERRVRLRQDD